MQIKTGNRTPKVEGVLKARHARRPWNVRLSDVAAVPRLVASSVVVKEPQDPKTPVACCGVDPQVLLQIRTRGNRPVKMLALML
jgi:hypothetical protein